MTLSGISIHDNLEFDHPPSNPIVLLNKWLETAEKTGVTEPRGFVLSTTNTQGHPSSRVVLLKTINEQGVVFTTNRESAKGKDLECSPYAAGTLWWRETIQQINFKGHVSLLPEEQSDHFFQERTKDAQAVSTISKQSALLGNEKELRNRVIDLIQTNNKIERPENWLAYCLVLESIEFWQGSKDRFHKRLQYNFISGSWHPCRLQP